MAVACKLSVIIPAFNAEADIQAALDGLAHSSYTGFAVVVVDDGSTDRTLEKASHAVLQPLVVRTLHAGASHARNAGVAASQGELLVFLDADVVAHPDTLERIVRAFEDPTLDAVIGSYDDQPYHPQFLSQYRNLMHAFYHRTGRPHASTFWAGCGAIRREAFLAVGGFDIRWYGIEDIELGYRLCDAGKRIALDPAILVQHRKRWTLASILRTDVFLRGMTWTELILRDKRMPDDLNTGAGQRVSVLAAGFLVLSLLAGWWWAALAALLLILTLNRSIFRFFAERRGWWFSLRTIPMFVLYLLYSGVAFALGAARYTWARLRKSPTGLHSPG